MPEPLDLDALDARGPMSSFVSSDGGVSMGVDYYSWKALIAELRATRAERDEIREDYARMLKWHDLAVARAERAEAERDAAIQSGWFQADRAERAEAERDDWRRSTQELRNEMEEWDFDEEVARMRARAERAEAAIALVEEVCTRELAFSPLTVKRVRAALRGDHD